MEVHLPPELEAKLKDAATRHGLSASEVLAHILTCYLVEKESPAPLARELA